MNIRAATSTTHLGRYHVVKRLAAGGMADVLLAKAAGSERHVVVKRIGRAQANDERYVAMFLDEELSAKRTSPSHEMVARRRGATT